MTLTSASVFEFEGATAEGTDSSTTSTDCFADDLGGVERDLFLALLFFPLAFEGVVGLVEDDDGDEEEDTDGFDSSWPFAIA